MPTAARHLVTMLRRLDADRVFCVPVESYLPVLDALADEPAIDLVTCRHGSGAGLMASADAKITDRPGVVFVSRGPGATNTALAVHTAEQDGAPLVLIIGQLSRQNLERGVFQKVDYERTFAHMAKLAGEVRDAGRLAETAADAFRVVTDATPGLVVISVQPHQEKRFPGRVAGTDLTNPDFAALGEAFGARGRVLDAPGDTPDVVRAALGHDGPVVVDVRTSLEHLSTYSTLTSLAGSPARA